MVETTNIARVSPSAPFILQGLGRLPLPTPIEGDGLTARSGIVADEGDICVFVEVWIGVELSCYQSFHLFRG
jgi:hypothetical protein